MIKCPSHNKGRKMTETGEYNRVTKTNSVIDQGKERVRVMQSEYDNCE